MPKNIFKQCFVLFRNKVHCRKYLYKISENINFKSQFQSNDRPQAKNYIKIASKLTSIVTILANIALAGEHIFQVLAQYS